jgi:formamidopyrimidine-DNA glycosylase
MPELPEVETMVRGIRPHVQGRRIDDILRPRCACKPLVIKPGLRALKSRCVGRRIESVARLAKRVVLRLDSGDAFAVEPRMTGLMLLSDPPDRGHLRLEWRLSGVGEYQSLWFWDRRGLGTITLYTSNEFRSLTDGRLGKDALKLSMADWRVLCGRTSRPIKVALLDQKLVAGIGNLYASEILHEARIHPAKPADSLTGRQIDRLRAAALHVLSEAIRYEGSTLGDGTYRNALNQDGGYQNEHRVYARTGQRCARCRRGTIVRIVQAQRSTFFCPNCQK